MIASRRRRLAFLAVCFIAWSMKRALLDPDLPSAPRRPQRDNCLHGLAPQGDLIAIEEPECTALKISEAHKAVGQQSGTIGRLFRSVLKYVRLLLDRAPRVIIGGAGAEQARLQGHGFEVVTIAVWPRFAQGQVGFLDPLSIRALRLGLRSTTFLV